MQCAVCGRGQIGYRTDTFSKKAANAKGMAFFWKGVVSRNVSSAFHIVGKSISSVLAVLTPKCFYFKLSF